MGRFKGLAKARWWVETENARLGPGLRATELDSRNSGRNLCILNDRECYLLELGLHLKIILNPFLRPFSQRDEGGEARVTREVSDGL